MTASESRIEGNRSRDTLLFVLERAKRWKLLSPELDAEAEVRRVSAVASLLAPPEKAVEIGPASGIVGLTMALLWPNSEWWLVERSETAVSHLRLALRELGIERRVRVEHQDAEDFARSWRESADLVVARCVGPPSEVAELSLPLLRPEGRLVVFEPPGSDGSRWVHLSDTPLGGKFLKIETPRNEPVSVAVITKVSTTPSRFPRPGKSRRRQPLW